MKTAFALAFIAVICGAHASSLSEIDGSAFGKNLLDTVYLQLKTGDNAQVVLDLLHQVADEITAEQAEHDSAHTAFQATCTVDLDFYTVQINQASADQTENQANIDRDQPALDRANEHHEELVGSLAKAESTLQLITDLIVGQREEFHQHEDDLNGAIQVFVAAKDILRQAFNVAEGSFLQTSVSSALAAHLNNAKVNGKYEPFVRILAQAASSGKLTAEGVQDVLSIIDRLLANTRETLAGETETMMKREAAFAEYSGQLNELINTLRNEIAGVELEINNLTSNLAEWHRNLDDANARWADYTQRFNDRSAECSAENADYTSATAKRAEDLKVVHEVEDILASRVADFTTYITQSRENVHID